MKNNEKITEKSANKLYKELKDYYSDYCGYDMFSDYENKDMRAYAKELKEEGYISLPNCGYRAQYKRFEDGHIILKSYYTDVCEIDNYNNFHKLWHGYSKTTLKHINAFCEHFGFPTFNKKEWVIFEEKRI